MNMAIIVQTLSVALQRRENAKSRDSKLFGAVSQNSDYKIEHREKCDISDEIGNCEAFL